MNKNYRNRNKFQPLNATMILMNKSMEIIDKINLSLEIKRKEDSFFKQA